ncbi:glycosyltransferase family 4 protein [Thiovibrio sp. JS02]
MAYSIALALEKFKKFSGGAESYALSLAETLISRGWKVHLYGQSWDGVPEKAIFHQIKVPECLPSWAQMLFFAFRHRQMARKEKHDVVVGFGNTIYMNVYQSHGGVHRHSTRRKCYSIRNPFLRFLKRLLIFFSLKDKVRNWIESAPFRQSPPPKIIAISQMVVDDIAAYFKFPKDQISLIYNGIDLDRFNVGLRNRLRGELRKRIDAADDQVVFLFLSYTLRKKGIFPLIDAAAILNERYKGKFKILVVGKEPQRSIREAVRKGALAETILFHGPTKTPEVYFANADVFVLPTYYDTCSLVTIEAMACGLPVITTEYNGAAGIIDSGRDGHVVKHPPSPEELVKVMAVYLSSDNLSGMSALAARKAQKFSLAANHEAVIKVCEEVASAKPTG